MCVSIQNASLVFLFKMAALHTKEHEQKEFIYVLFVFAFL